MIFIACPYNVIKLDFFSKKICMKKKTATSNSDFISHFFKSTLEIRSSDITIACLYLVILIFSPNCEIKYFLQGSNYFMLVCSGTIKLY